MDYKERIKMRVQIEFTCPLCNTEQTQLIEMESRFDNKHFISCDSEEQGGCGETLAINVRLKPSVTVYRLEKD